MSEYPVEGERFEWNVRLAVANIQIKKPATVQRLGKKVVIIITEPTEKDAENLVTDLGAEPIP